MTQKSSERGNTLSRRPADDIIVAAMRRAIELSSLGPVADPNPQVGCVILSADGVVLAEGWHRGAGTPHAEADALGKLPHRSDAAGATAVVTLEPCNHQGRTGPCSHALADAGIAHVVYGASDPGSLSSGGGEYLRSRGVEVEAGLLSEEATQSIGAWLDRVRNARPFVTVKWASSMDGRAAAADGTSRWITGELSRADVHLRRSRADAIAVGTGTVLIDDPALTARTVDGALFGRQPIPVVIGKREVPAESALRAHPRTLQHFSGHDLAEICADLFAQGVNSLFVEGGPTLASAFLRAGLADEIVVYLAPLLLGGPRTSVADIGVHTLVDGVRLRLDDITRLGEDLRIIAHPIRDNSEES